MYKLNHPLITDNPLFDSWMTLCEFVMDIAEKEAHLRLSEQLHNLISSISDEIIETAQEYENANN